MSLLASQCDVYFKMERHFQYTLYTAMFANGLYLSTHNSQTDSSRITVQKVNIIENRTQRSIQAPFDFLTAKKPAMWFDNNQNF